MNLLKDQVVGESGKHGVEETEGEASSRKPGPLLLTISLSHIVIHSSYTHDTYGEPVLCYTQGTQETMRRGPRPRELRVPGRRQASPTWLLVW